MRRTFPRRGEYDDRRAGVVAGLPSHQACLGQPVDQSDGAGMRQAEHLTQPVDGRPIEKVVQRRGAAADVAEPAGVSSTASAIRSTRRSARAPDGWRQRRNPLAAEASRNRPSAQIVVERVARSAVLVRPVGAAAAHAFEVAGSRTGDDRERRFRDLAVEMPSGLLEPAAGVGPDRALNLAEADDVGGATGEVAL